MPNQEKLQKRKEFLLNLRKGRVLSKSNGESKEDSEEQIINKLLDNNDLNEVLNELEKYVPLVLDGSNPDAICVKYLLINLFKEIIEKNTFTKAIFYQNINKHFSKFYLIIKDKLLTKQIEVALITESNKINFNGINNISNQFHKKIALYKLIEEINTSKRRKIEIDLENFQQLDLSSQELFLILIDQTKDTLEIEFSKIEKEFKENDESQKLRAYVKQINARNKFLEEFQDNIEIKSSGWDLAINNWLESITTVSESNEISFFKPVFLDLNKPNTLELARPVYHRNKLIYEMQETFMEKCLDKLLKKSTQVFTSFNYNPAQLYAQAGIFDSKDESQYSVNHQIIDHIAKRLPKLPLKKIKIIDISLQHDDKKQLAQSIINLIKKSHESSLEIIELEIKDQTIFDFTFEIETETIKNNIKIIEKKQIKFFEYVLEIIKNNKQTTLISFHNDINTKYKEIICQINNEVAKNKRNAYKNRFDRKKEEKAIEKKRESYDLTPDNFSLYLQKNSKYIQYNVSLQNQQEQQRQIQKQNQLQLESQKQNQLFDPNIRRIKKEGLISYDNIQDNKQLSTLLFSICSTKTGTNEFESYNENGELQLKKLWINIFGRNLKYTIHYATPEALNKIVNFHYQFCNLGINLQNLPDGFFIQKTEDTDELVLNYSSTHINQNKTPLTQTFESQNEVSSSFYTKTSLNQFELEEKKGISDEFISSFIKKNASDDDMNMFYLIQYMEKEDEQNANILKNEYKEIFQEVFYRSKFKSAIWSLFLEKGCFGIKILLDKLIKLKETKNEMYYSLLKYIGSSRNLNEWVTDDYLNILDEIDKMQENDARWFSELLRPHHDGFGTKNLVILFKAFTYFKFEYKKIILKHDPTMDDDDIELPLLNMRVSNVSNMQVGLDRILNILRSSSDPLDQLKEIITSGKLLSFSPDGSEYTVLYHHYKFVSKHMGLNPDQQAILDNQTQYEIDKRKLYKLMIAEKESKIGSAEEFNWKYIFRYLGPKIHPDNANSDYFDSYYKIFKGLKDYSEKAKNQLQDFKLEIDFDQAQDLSISLLFETYIPYLIAITSNNTSPELIKNNYIKRFENIPLALLPLTKIIFEVVTEICSRTKNEFSFHQIIKIIEQINEHLEYYRSIKRPLQLADYKNYIEKLVNTSFKYSNKFRDYGNFLDILSLRSSTNIPLDTLLDVINEFFVDENNKNNIDYIINPLNLIKIISLIKYSPFNENKINNLLNLLNVNDKNHDKYLYKIEDIILNSTIRTNLNNLISLLSCNDNNNLFSIDKLEILINYIKSFDKVITKNRLIEIIKRNDIFPNMIIGNQNLLNPNLTRIDSLIPDEKLTVIAKKMPDKIWEISKTLYFSIREYLLSDSFSHNVTYFLKNLETVSEYLSREISTLFEIIQDASEYKDMSLTDKTAYRAGLVLSKSLADTALSDGANLLEKITQEMYQELNEYTIEKSNLGNSKLSSLLIKLAEDFNTQNRFNTSIEEKYQDLMSIKQNDLNDIKFFKEKLKPLFELISNKINRFLQYQSIINTFNVIFSRFPNDENVINLINWLYENYDIDNILFILNDVILKLPEKNKTIPSIQTINNIIFSNLDRNLILSHIKLIYEKNCLSKDKDYLLELLIFDSSYLKFIKDYPSYSNPLSYNLQIIHQLISEEKVDVEHLEQLKNKSNDFINLIINHTEIEKLAKNKKIKNKEEKDEDKKDEIKEDKQTFKEDISNYISENLLKFHQFFKSISDIDIYNKIITFLLDKYKNSQITENKIIDIMTIVIHIKNDNNLSLTANEIFILIQNLDKISESKISKLTPLCTKNEILYQQIVNLNHENINDFIKSLRPTENLNRDIQAQKSCKNAYEIISNIIDLNTNEDIEFNVSKKLSTSQIEELFIDFNIVNEIGLNKNILTSINNSDEKSDHKIDDNPFYLYDDDALKNLFKSCCNEISQGEQNKGSYLKLIAVLREVMFRNHPKHFFPNSTQIISILNIVLNGGNFSGSEINTGEGKGIITAMLAAILAAQQSGTKKSSVCVFTSNLDLAKRDSEEFQDFFTALGLKVGNNVITPSSDINDYEDNAIHFTSPDAYALFKAKMLYQHPDFFSDRQDVAIIDEGDTFFHEKTPILYKYSTTLNNEDSSTNKFEAIYPILNEFADVAIPLEGELAGEMPPPDPALIADFAERLRTDDKLDQAVIHQIKEDMIIKWLSSAINSKKLKKDVDYVLIEGELNGKKVIFAKLLIENRKSDSTLQNGGQQSLHARINAEIEQGKLNIEDRDIRAPILPEVSPVILLSDTNIAKGFVKIHFITGTIGNKKEKQVLTNNNYYLSKIPPHRQSNLKELATIVTKNDVEHSSKCIELITNQLEKSAEDLVSNHQPQPIVGLLSSIPKTEKIYKDFKAKWEKGEIRGCDRLILITANTISYIEKGKKPSIITNSEAIKLAGLSGSVTFTTTEGRGTDFKPVTHLIQNITHPLGLCAYIMELPNSWSDLNQKKGRSGRQGQEGIVQICITEEEIPTYKAKSLQDPNNQSEINEAITKAITKKENERDLKIQLINAFSLIHDKFQTQFLQLKNSIKEKPQFSNELISILEPKWVQFNSSSQEQWKKLTETIVFNLDLDKQINDIKNEFTEYLQKQWKNLINEMNIEFNRLDSIYKAEQKKLKDFELRKQQEQLEANKKENKPLNPITNVNNSTSSELVKAPTSPNFLEKLKRLFKRKNKEKLSLKSSNNSIQGKLEPIKVKGNQQEVSDSTQTFIKQPQQNTQITYVQQSAPRQYVDQTDTPGYTLLEVKQPANKANDSSGYTIPPFLPQSNSLSVQQAESPKTENTLPISLKNLVQEEEIKEFASPPQEETQSIESNIQTNEPTGSHFSNFLEFNKTEPVNTNKKLTTHEFYKKTNNIFDEDYYSPLEILKQNFKYDVKTSSKDLEETELEKFINAIKKDNLLKKIIKEEKPLDDKSFIQLIIPKLLELIYFSSTDRIIPELNSKLSASEETRIYHFTKNFIALLFETEHKDLTNNLIANTINNKLKFYSIHEYNFFEKLKNKKDYITEFNMLNNFMYKTSSLSSKIRSRSNIFNENIWLKALDKYQKSFFIEKNRSNEALTIQKELTKNNIIKTLNAVTTSINSVLKNDFKSDKKWHRLFKRNIKNSRYIQLMNNIIDNIFVISKPSEFDSIVMVMNKHFSNLIERVLERGNNKELPIYISLNQFKNFFNSNKHNKNTTEFYIELLDLIENIKKFKNDEKLNKKPSIQDKNFYEVLDILESLAKKTTDYYHQNDKVESALTNTKSNKKLSLLAIKALEPDSKIIPESSDYQIFNEAKISDQQRKQFSKTIAKLRYLLIKHLPDTAVSLEKTDLEIRNNILLVNFKLKLNNDTLTFSYQMDTNTDVIKFNNSEVLFEPKPSMNSR